MFHIIRLNDYFKLSKEKSRIIDDNYQQLKTMLTEWQRYSPHPQQHMVHILDIVYMIGKLKNYTLCLRYIKSKYSEKYESYKIKIINWIVKGDLFIKNCNILVSNLEQIQNNTINPNYIKTKDELIITFTQLETQIIDTFTTFNWEETKKNKYLIRGIPRTSFECWLISSIQLLGNIKDFEKYIKVRQNNKKEITEFEIKIINIIDKALKCKYSQNEKTNLEWNEIAKQFSKIPFYNVNTLTADDLSRLDKYPVWYISRTQTKFNLKTEYHYDDEFNINKYQSILENLGCIIEYMNYIKDNDEGAKFYRTINPKFKYEIYYKDININNQELENLLKKTVVEKFNLLSDIKNFNRNDNVLYELGNNQYILQNIINVNNFVGYDINGHYMLSVGHSMEDNIYDFYKKLDMILFSVNFKVDNNRMLLVKWKFYKVPKYLFFLTLVSHINVKINNSIIQDYPLYITIKDYKDKNHYLELVNIIILTDLGGGHFLNILKLKETGEWVILNDHKCEFINEKMLLENYLHKFRNKVSPLAYIVNYRKIKIKKLSLDKIINKNKLDSDIYWQVPSKEICLKNYKTTDEFDKLEYFHKIEHSIVYEGNNYFFEFKLIDTNKTDNNLTVKYKLPDIDNVLKKLKSIPYLSGLDNIDEINKLFSNNPIVSTCIYINKSENINDFVNYFVKIIKIPFPLIFYINLLDSEYLLSNNESTMFKSVLKCRWCMKNFVFDLKKNKSVISIKENTKILIPHKSHLVVNGNSKIPILTKYYSLFGIFFNDEEYIATIPYYLFHINDWGYFKLFHYKCLIKYIHYYEATHVNSWTSFSKEITYPYFCNDMFSKFNFTNEGHTKYFCTFLYTLVNSAMSHINYIK